MAGASKANQRQGRTHKPQYTKYATEAHWAKNKVKRLLKYVKARPNDSVAFDCLLRVGKQLGRDYSNILKEGQSGIV